MRIRIIGVSTLVIAALVLLSGPVSAQSTTSGTIRGTVTDPQGGVMPGATVVARSDALVAGQAVTVTGGGGGYRYPSLPPGDYTMEAQLAGFQTVRRENVRLGVGESIEVNLQLGDLEFTDEIVVVADSAQVNSVSNTVSYNLDTEFLERQPLPRDTTALMNYTPGINDKAAYGAANSQASAYNLDGVDVSDPAGGSQWILPNFNWIEEVQVTGLGADAEFGGFTGAMVNLVTKSGGNEFHGDAAVFYSGSDLSSSDTADEVDSDWELTLGLGGKIVQDRLWYFISGEERRRAINRFFADGAPVDEQDQYQRDFHRYLGKLTFQASQSNKLAFSVAHDGIDTANRDIGDFVLSSGAQNQDSPNTSFNVTWESVLNNRNFIAVKATGFKGTNDRLPKAGADVPARRDFFNSGFEWDNYMYTWLEDKNRLNLDASWSLFAGGVFSENDTHNIKIGVVYETSSIDETRTRNGGFTYDDDSWWCGDTYEEQLDEYFADPFCGVFSSTRGGGIDLNAVQQGWHLYAQDAWQIGRVTVNAGVRYTDYKGGFDNGNEDVYQADMVAPRLGFVWDVSGNGTTAIKAHYGRYYDALMVYMYDREVSGDAFEDREFWDYNFDTGEFDIFFGRRVPGTATIDPDITHPSVDQLVVSLEHQLGRDVLIGADYVRREFNDILAMVNTNDDYDALVAPDNPLTGDGLPFFELLSPPNNFITNPEQATREYDAVTLRLFKRYSNGWRLDGSIVWADATGNTDDVDGYEPSFEDLNGQVNNLGTLPGVSEWEVKINASVDLPWDMVLGGYYLYRSGEYWTPYATIRGLLENNNAEINLLPRGSFQLEDRHVFDLHWDKRFRFSDRLSLTLLLDVFNLFDSDTVLGVQERWGTYDYVWDAHPEESEWLDSSSYGAPVTREFAREIRLGARVSF
jgi:hypothetical protein